MSLGFRFSCRHRVLQAHSFMVYLQGESENLMFGKREKQGDPMVSYQNQGRLKAKELPLGEVVWVFT